MIIEPLAIGYAFGAGVMATVCAGVLLAWLARGVKPDYFSLFFCVVVWPYTLTKIVRELIVRNG